MAQATIHPKLRGNINWVSDLEDPAVGEEYQSASEVGL